MIFNLQCYGREFLTSATDAADAAGQMHNLYRMPGLLVEPADYDGPNDAAQAFIVGDAADESDRLYVVITQEAAA